MSAVLKLAGLALCKSCQGFFGLGWGFFIIFPCCTEAACPQNKCNKLCALQGDSCEHTELAVFMYTEF